MNLSKFQTISTLLRYYSLLCTTTAGSGHPTSALSAADIMSVLYFNFFRYDFKNQHNPDNDRLIFSKGHASPLLYSLYKLAGYISEEDLLKYRTFESPLQGHPTPQAPFVDVATGSLGMGLSFGLGMALTSKLDKIDNKVYVLLGDGEMAEGSIWETLQIASYYKTSNLVGIIDVNRLGQTGPTMLEHDTKTFETRIRAFGWKTITIDGHNYQEIFNAFEQLQHEKELPTMIIAKTLKGKGVSFLENKENWHGKALSQEELQKATQELKIEEQDKHLVFPVKNPAQNQGHSEPLAQSRTKNPPPDKAQSQQSSGEELEEVSYNIINALSQLTSDKPIATRQAYGLALKYLITQNSNLIVLDADMGNSTYTNYAKEEQPNQFFNVFISEQNMIGMAVGLSKMGKKVIASTFAAFLTRAYDQLRIASLSEANINIQTSHAGVSIGEDGATQMGLEDIAMMRTIQNSTILYPSDPISTIKLVPQMLNTSDICYIRTTRQPTKTIYEPTEEFPIGGLKVLCSSPHDICTIVTAGITVHESLKAYEELQKQKINIRVVDLYSIKPVDSRALQDAAHHSKNKIIVVEDHFTEGGIGDAVLNVFAQDKNTQIHKLAITGHPHSGKPLELLEKYNISSEAIVKKVLEIIK